VTSRRQTWLTAAVLSAAALLRFFVDNVTEFSPADETVYLRYVQLLTGGGHYRDLVRMFLGDRGMWIFPNPLRWSYLGAAALLSWVTQQCSYSTLALLSTLAGIACVALAYDIGRRLFDENTALFAAAMMATSPLQLAMGRRALADEFFCAMILASIAAMLAFRGAWPWIIVTTLAFGAKEQFLFAYPFVLLFWWLRERRLRWEWLLPPALFYGVFCLLARDLHSFFDVGRVITSVMNAPYADQYQNGPPHRLLIDLMIVAPLVTSAFLIAARARRREPLVILAAGILIVHSLISSKNLRYVIGVDPLMRLVVASAFPRRTFLIVNAIVELALFFVIFVSGEVYDPVTVDLLRALHMIPR